MDRLVSACAVLLASTVVGAPCIDPAAVSVEQDAETKLVSIRYVLSGEPAIVTVDVRTNGVSIGGANLRYMMGDVNMLVDNGSSQRSISWDVRKAWPGHKIDESLTVAVSAWPTNMPPEWMAVDLMLPNTVRFYASAGEVPGDVTNDLYRTEWMLFRKIPSGHVSWHMGSPVAEGGRNANESLHEVTLHDDFYLGIYPVTVCQNGLLCGEALNIDGKQPIRLVEYAQARGSNWPSETQPTADSYVGRLRKHVGGGEFDLPLEAQWEFACRAGSPFDLPYSVNATGQLYKPSREEVAVYAGTGGQVSDRVGSKLPNAFGLYDMIGACTELCRDYYVDDLMGIDPEIGPTEGGNRVLRSCSFHREWQYARCAFRTTNGDLWGDLPGFRICCRVGKGEAR